MPAHETILKMYKTCASSGKPAVHALDLTVGESTSKVKSRKAFDECLREKLAKHE